MAATLSTATIRRCFTLIDLMVVLAIMGILAALLLPVLFHARDSGRETQCAGKMHQIGVDMTAFASANLGRFPYTIHGGLARSWVNSLAHYSNTVRICPDDPSGDDRLKSLQPGTSYLLNEYISNEQLTGAVVFRSRLRSASNTLAFFEGTETRSLAPSADHANPQSWYTPIKVAQEKVWEEALKEIKPDRHGDGANYLYADGHTLAVPRDTVHGWVQADITDGTCFAKPDYIPK